MHRHRQLCTKTACDVSRHLFPRLMSSLLAGPADALSPLLAALKAEKVFVREVDTLGVAYHSPALLPFAEDLRSGRAWMHAQMCLVIQTQELFCLTIRDLCRMLCSFSDNLDLQPDPQVCTRNMLTACLALARAGKTSVPCIATWN